MQSDAMQVAGASSVSGGGLETRGVPTLSSPSLPSRWSEAAKSKTLELSSCGKVVYHKGTLTHPKAIAVSGSVMGM